MPSNWFRWLVSTLQNHAHTGSDGSSQITGAALSTWSGTSDIANVAAAKGAGVGTVVPRGDHVHAIPSGLITNDMVSASAGVEPSKFSTNAFYAYRSSSVANVTGDGTAYTGIFDSEVFDLGNGYDPTTGIFTAPVTGKYVFTAVCHLTNVGAAHNDAYLQLTGTFGTIRSIQLNAGAVRESNTSVALTLTSPPLAFSINQTAKIVVYVFLSTKTITFVGLAAEGVSYFGGYRVA